MIGMLRKGARYLRISLNPVAFERDRARLQAMLEKKEKQIEALRGKVEALRGKVEKKDRQIEALRGKVEKKDRQIETLRGVVPTDWDVIEFNTVDSMNRFWSSDLNVDRCCADKWKSELFLDLLVNNVEIDEDSRILDAGCGVGVFAKLIQERLGARDVHGFDFSSVAIAQANMQSNGIAFFTHSIYDALDGEYDVVTCTEVLEHLTEPEAAVQSLMACLSSKGVLFLTVPDGRVDYTRQHIHFWSPESWEILVNRLARGSVDVKVGTGQHPRKATSRYNWAILKRKG